MVSHSNGDAMCPEMSKQLKQSTCRMTSAALVFCDNFEEYILKYLDFILSLCPDKMNQVMCHGEIC